MALNRVLYLCLAALWFAAAQRQPSTAGHVVCGEACHFVSGPGKGAAFGSYTDGSNSVSGWGQLHIATTEGQPDLTALRAAGYLEGWLTAERIYDHHVNMKAFYNLSTNKPADWLVEQDAWARQQVAEHASDAQWTLVGLLHAQQDGLLEGYNARVTSLQQSLGGAAALPHLTKTDLLLVSAVGDLGDLQPALEPRGVKLQDMQDPGAVMAKLTETSKCSALVKVTGNLDNLLLSHSSWFTYSGMVRIYKHYDFKLQNPAHKLQRASFSGYPGELSSDDDFYLMDTGLALLQTTNDVLDTSLYDLLTPASLLSWQRVRLANAMATSGREWADLVAWHNSGTYCNQYMVVDLKLFQPGRELQPNTLWVVEQVPSLSVAEDQTQALVMGYWPSFNVPFYPAIANASGFNRFAAELQSRGPEWKEAAAALSHQLAPRATLFRRDVGTVTDLASLKRLMRSNDYQHDPYSLGRSTSAICGRADLDADRPRPYGCYDTKVADWASALQLEAEGVVGPTTAGGLSPFSWSGEFASAAHLGQPEVFNFTFEVLKRDSFAEWTHTGREALNIESLQSQ
ncbi:hypothetical protein WJX73_007462 [Symbiochloris irregularis]|uniref:Phospholipase B-like n=1 Tax=Symbiochloris irregularis TaxID=706552 RepID=A0AAW1NXB6_9CHLO